MSYNNPTIPTISAPTGLDSVIESIRVALSAMTWLDKSFGRAWEFKEKNADGKTLKLPKVFIGSNGTEGEYLNVLPNDFLKSQSFIAVRGPEKWEQFNKNNGSMKIRKLSVIFWVNLKDIDPSKNFIFIDQLKDQVEAIIAAHPDVKSIDEYYDERAEDVFDGYDVGLNSGDYSIDDVKSQYLMYPYSGFRFDFTVMYPQVC
jgi:hypothetical protein